MIYLDHAATSWPKSPAVLAAVQRWFTDVGVSESRGASAQCQIAAHEVAQARAAVAGLVGVPPDRVAFVSGATEGLNLVLRALLRPGANVLTTAFEHSSVARPLRALQDERRLAIHVLRPVNGGIDPADVEQALRRTRIDLFIFTHASNVTGACLDAALLCRMAREMGVPTVLDASQTAGLLDLRVGADVVVASCHKALGSPPGLGFVASALPLLPQKQGGTGHGRSLDRHPTHWPAAFEAGTPNTPAIFGLRAARHARTPADEERDLRRALACIDALADGLAGARGWRLLGAATPQRVPILSLVHEQLDPAEIGAVLADRGIHVRTGQHCAPWLHEHLRTGPAGTVRCSAGATTTDADIACTLAVLRSL